MEISNSLYLKIVQSIRDGVMLIDQESKIVWANESLEALFGYDHGELINKDMEILIAEQYRGRHKKLAKSFFSNPAKRPMGGARDFEGRKKDGSAVWVKIGLNYYEQGNEFLAIASVSDKTEKRYIQLDAAKHADRAELFFNLSKAIFVELDHTGSVSLINQAGLEILEYDESEVLGKNWFELIVAPFDLPKVQNVFSHLIGDKINQSEFVNSHILTKNKRTKLIQWHNSVVRDDNGKPTGTISSGVDITPIEELKKKQTEAMLLGTEKERKRVAIELHDGLVQTLSAVSMYLKSFEDNMKLLTVDNQKAYNDALSLIVDSIADTRAISHDLMPNAITRDGLISALDDLALRTSKYHGLKVTIDPDHVNDGLSENYRLNIYRIIQELIHNTIKHADANSADIVIRKNAKVVSIVYIDDGHGFDEPLETIQGNGIGIQNIFTRVGAMKGSVEIKSSSKNGTKVNISIPVSY